MVIRLDENYNAMTSTALLGYVGETNARPVSVEGLTVDGADHYVLTIDYGDGTVYEVDITGGTWTPTADILRSAQTVSCQICAKKLSGQEYILVKKSRIFRLRIGAAIGNNAVPSPDVAMDALDRIDAIGRQAHADMQTAETAAQTAQSIADSLPDDYTTAVAKIAENTAEIANVKLTDKELQRSVDALYDMGQGITHKFETDSETAYQKTVPTGGKLMSVKSIGGHSEVIDGEIVSAGVTEVVEQGKNLFDYTDKTYNGANVSKVENGVIYTKGATTTVLNIPTIVGSKYTLSFKVKSSGANQGGLRWSLQTGKNTSYAHDSSLIKSEVGYAANTEYQAVATFVADTDFVSLCTILGMVYDVQLELGDTATDYSSFYQTACQIPEAIKALPGYGWSAGNARNYVDYENKKYYQCVQSVDLGTLDWKINTTSSVGNHFYALADHLNFKYLGEFGSTIYNALCSKYRTVARNSHVFVDKTLAIDGVTVVSQIQIKDTAYTDATAFKQAMQGVMLYYELETPIVTDISTMIPDDFLRNIEVEAGGSVTFKNSNGDNYKIPVPSEEEYIVKLSEIGGTT